MVENTKIILSAEDRTRAAFRSAEGSVKRLAGDMRELRNVSRALLGAFGARFSIQGLRSLGEVADRMKLIDARLRLATKSQTEFTAAQVGTLGIARRTGQSLTDTVNLYARLADAIRVLGGSQEDTLKLTETINKAIVVSGAAASASAAGIQQLAQAFASGVLRGDEFNSVMENTPRVARAIADGLGVPIGALRAMAEQGQLTADVVTRALAGQADAIEREFAQMPLTIGRAFQNLGTEFEQFVKHANDATDASGSFARGVQFLAEHLDDLATTIGQAVTALAIAFGGAAFAGSVAGVGRLATGVRAVNGALVALVSGGALVRLGALAAGASGGVIGLALFGATTAAVLVGQIESVRNALSHLLPDQDIDLRNLKEKRTELALLKKEASDPRKAGFGLDSRIKELTKIIALETESAKISRSSSQAASLANIRRPGPQAGAITTQVNPDFKARIKATEEAFDREQKAAEKADAEARKRGKRLANVDQQRLDSIKALIVAAQEEAETYGKTAREVALYQAAKEGANKSQLAQISASLRVVEGLQAEEKQTEALLAEQEKVEEATQSAVDKQRTYIEGLDDQADAVRDVIQPMRPFVKELEKIRELFDTKRINVQEFNLAVTELGTRMTQAARDIENADSAVNEFAREAARNIQSALADILFDPFKDGLGGMLKQFEDVLRRMAANALAANLAKKLFGDFGSDSGDVGGLIGGLLKSVGGFFTKSFHAGGIIGSGGRDRMVPALAFAGAPRFHGGGILGLAPNEVPIIGQAGEEVLTRDDPRHRDNGAGRQSVVININNPKDAQDVIRSRSQIESQLRSAAARGVRNS